MSSTRTKQIVLFLGILIAVLIGVNAYATSPILNNNPDDNTISLIEKLKSSADLNFIKD